MKFWPLGCREAFLKDFLLRLDKIYVKYVRTRKDLSPPRVSWKRFCATTEEVLRDMTQLEEMELLDSDSEANGNVGD